MALDGNGRGSGCPKFRKKGLGFEDAARRLAENGPNQLESPTKPSPLKIFLGKFKDYMVLVLVFAALISYIAGETTNAYVILGIVVLVAIIGFVQEYKAERAMEALRETLAPEADAIRGGKMVTIPAVDLVPGHWPGTGTCPRRDHAPKTPRSQGAYAH